MAKSERLQKNIANGGCFDRTCDYLTSAGIGSHLVE